MNQPYRVGTFLMEIGRPARAAEYFLKPPPNYVDAERALFAAYKVEKGDAKRDALLQDIELLLTNLNNEMTATERIRLFEKEFPQAPHPFKYYLMSPAEKVAYLFERVAFVYAKTLDQFLENEMSQIHLGAKPHVQLRKTDAGTYRIIATFKGEVTLNKDKLPNITFVFWEVNDRWIIADTNLTVERQKFAAKERERFASKELKESDALSLFQFLFKREFPKRQYHQPEPVEKEHPASKDSF